MNHLPPTPAQTVGPFFHYGLEYRGDADLVPPGRLDAVVLHGRVTDGHGDPIDDALVELWQADPDGVIIQQPGSLHRDGWTFTGWGRSATDPEGRYAFSTLVPGASGAGHAPYFALTVFARGLLDRLFTRAYLPGDAVDDDQLLRSLPDDRRATLVATADARGFAFDIRLQGSCETVFLDYSPR